MIIECIGSPFTYRWPTGEVHLEPGKPVDLPDERARRLLDKAPGKVRVCPLTIAAGCQVTWTRGDGTRQEAFVDAIHTDDTGTRWALVALPCGTWAAINLKLLKRANA